MSKVDFGAKPWVFPMPVLIVGTYDENGVPNATKSSKVNAPLIDELPMALECKVKSFEDGMKLK